MPKALDAVIRSVRLHCPLADPFLVQDWIQSHFNRLCERRRWSFLRAEGEIITNSASTGTCGVTRNSDIVTAGTLTFSASDVGRQFKVSGPPYTIAALAGADIQLDRVYGDATDSAATGRVLDAYFTAPEGFGSFIAVLDPTNDWMIYPWATEDQLNFRDPNRDEVASSDPEVLASRRPATHPTSIAGRMQYELWPYQTSARRYPYYYSKRPPELALSDYFVGPLRDRTDLLVLLALAEASEWPGLAEKRNPYYDLALAKRKRDQAEQAIQDFERADEEVYMTWLETESWIRRKPWGPGSANWLREHE